MSITIPNVDKRSVRTTFKGCPYYNLITMIYIECSFKKIASVIIPDINLNKTYSHRYLSLRWIQSKNDPPRLLTSALQLMLFLIGKVDLKSVLCLCLSVNTKHDIRILELQITLLSSYLKATSNSSLNIPLKQSIKAFQEELKQSCGIFILRKKIEELESCLKDLESI